MLFDVQTSQFKPNLAG